jgi:BASS family bile acid:Na+ symporter
MNSVLDGVLQAAVIVFMIGSLLGVGTSVAPREALAPLAHKRFVALTLLIGWVVCPIVAWALLELVPLERPYAIGLLMLSLAPGAPFAPAMMQIARSDAGHTAAYMVLASLATVALMPALVPVLIKGVSADPLLIARPLVAFVLLPLVGGLALRHFDARLAERVRPLVAKVTSAAGGALLVLIAVRHGRDVVGAVGSFAIATQIVFVAAITALAHLLGAGLRADQRSVLTLGTCARNLGAALAPLAAIERDPRALVMIAIGAPVTIVLSVITARRLARSSM